MKFALLFLVFSFIIFFSFISPQAYAKTCSYSPDESSLSVQWTGFKTTQKVPVPGKFLKAKNLKKIETSYPSLKALLKAVIVQVDITSADSGNPQRDETLKQKFFNVLKGNKISTAFLTGIKENADHSGSATMTLRFNKQTKKVPVTFTYLDGLVTVKGSFDILNFTAYRALESLNQACLELHKGADGVSKTWSEVEFVASGKVSEKCQEAAISQ